MDKWVYDEEVISMSRGYLEDDELTADLTGMTVRELSEACREDSEELADYISTNFELDAPLADHQFTGREAIEAMRKGTPAGISYYIIAGIWYAGHQDLTA